MPWRTTNRWIYRTAHRVDGMLRRSGGLRRELAGAARRDANGPLLYLANGRLGDALLAATFTRHYRAWFGSVIAVGRPETAAVVAPLVDRFVPFAPDAADPAVGTDALRAAAAAGCRAVLGDLHLFHGGDALLALAAATAAPAVVYDGWIDRDRQAPFRRWPASAHVVAALDKAGASMDPQRLHVSVDLLHYHRAALTHLGVAADLPERPWLPDALRDPVAAAGLDLPAGYIACHPASSQPKKDWPLRHFAAVFAACPDLTFCVLGTDTAPPLPRLANVRDLRGRTTVTAAVAVAANARAFLGIDSGLAHAAAIAGVPTVVAMPAATPGFFFPYPQAFGSHVQAVWSQAHRACAGCGGLCVLEPIWRSRRRGFPCLRAVTVDAVVAALRSGLG